MAADFIYFDLNQQPRGAVVEIELGTAVNVLLVDSSNFASYRAGRAYRYYGGQARTSPVRLAVPHGGHWYLVLDLGGYPGTIRHSNPRILPGPLPPLRNAAPQLAEIADNAADLDDSESRPHDVFISHASDDKDEVARPLALALERRGLEVWLDESEIRVGDSLRRRIDSGISQSRFGVVVLSPAFFGKNWPQYELDGLVTREMGNGDQILLPLWHQVGEAEVANWSPSLAGRYALRTADLTIEQIAEQIAEVVGADRAS